MPIEILMPALSPTMTEGNLAKWLKKEGDKVSPGDVIAEIETDKATMEVEAIDAGILAKILVAEGSQNVAVNELIAIILEEGEDASSIAIDKPILEADTTKIEEKEHSDINISNEVLMHNSISSDRIIASPLAKRIAIENSIDLSNVIGSGPRGRIIKQDVLNHKQIKNTSENVSKVASREDHIKIPNSNMRKVIAKRLTESKRNVPHFYLSLECNLDKLLALRQELNANSEIHKLSVNDFVIKASAQALRSTPAANATWTDDAIIQYNNVDISIAVAIEGGLITPIIKDADLKSISIISSEMKDLAKRAREGKLAPHEFQGGNFSISNLGMFNIEKFNAIINPPQACIIAVGAGIKKPVVIDDQISIATMMNVTLSVDHRVVDGAVGASFLNNFKKFIENPILMLV